MRSSKVFIFSLTSFCLGFIGAVLLVRSPFFQFYNQFYQVVPVMNQQPALTGSSVGQSDLNLSLFWEAYDIISQNYIGFENVSKKDISIGAIKGIMLALKDKHSEYFDLEETKKFNEALSGDFEGIGAVIDKHDLGVRIERIIAGSPAKEFGLFSGDVITKVDGKDISNFTVNEAVSVIRGPANTKVVLTVLRSGEMQPLEKTVTRQKVVIPSVDSKVIDGNIGYVQLSIYGEKSAEDVEKALSDLSRQKVTWLILDLRDNGGGYLESAVGILSYFVEKDRLLVTTKEKNPKLNRSYFSKDTPKYDLPLVVLINENSASASEITAGALKDYKRAVIVGEKSYGKWSVQEPFGLSDGSEMKVTVAKWYTPNDIGIDKIGIEPNLRVRFEKEDFEKKFDRQLEESKKTLKRLIDAKSVDTVLQQLESEKTAREKELKEHALSGSVQQ